ncbi:MAG: hypothetical protein M1827_000393 [Pycnora praestabilis]|nr:MAG: hypothetical protein M1827_000393 [Pycnora praestabilis]
MTMIAVTFLLLIVVEVLREKSLPDGGILFAESLSGLSEIRRFAYLYLPTVVVVIYSITWAWIDLDVKRMEPYFQVSRTGGAQASQSLFMSYPHDFLPLAPIKAAKRRHWAVVYSGSIMLLTFWGITPFQNAVIGTSIVHTTSNASFLRSSGLLPIDKQMQALSANFFYTAYNQAWLGVQPPPFMTNDSSFLAAEPTEATGSQSFTFPSQRYFSTLICISGIDQGNYTYLDGRGCSYAMESGFPFPNNVRNHEAVFAGQVSQTDQLIRETINIASVNGNCTVDERQTFALIWSAQAFINDTNPKVTALFCNPRYLYEEVDLTVSSNSSVSLFNSLSTANELPPSMFNATRFEEVLSKETITSGTLTSNFPVDTLPIPPQSSLSDIDTFTNLVGYGLPFGPTNYYEYLDKSILQQAFSEAYNLLFVAAVQSLQDPTSLSVEVNGTQVKEQEAVVIVQSYAVLLEAFLALTCILALILLLHCYSRFSNLHSDPSSLSHTMSLVSESTNLLRTFKISLSSDRQSKKGSQVYGHVRTDLRNWCSGAPYRLDTPDRDTAAIGEWEKVEKQTKPKPDKQFNGNPVEASVLFGICFTIFVAATLGTISFLWKRALNTQGLSPISTHVLSVQLLFSYLPSAVITFMDPLWTLINRYLCTCQPLIELQRRATPAKQSLSLKYTSLPPAFAFGKAIRSKHLLLATVSGMTLSMNVLSVAFSSLFNEELRNVTAPHEFSQQYYTRLQIPEFPYTANPSLESNITEADSFYIAKAFLYDDARLPPWVSSEYFFAPFNFNVSNHVAAGLYTAETTGYQGTLDCWQVADNDTSNLSLSLTNQTVVATTTSEDPINITSMVSMVGANITIQDKNGINVPCGRLSLTYGTAGILIFGNDSSTGEYYQVMDVADHSFGRDNSSRFACLNTVLAGWFRANTTTNPQWDARGQSNSSISSYDYTMIACQQRVAAYPFNVTVDSSGHIIDQDLLGSQIEPSALFESTDTQDNFTSQLTPIFAQTLGETYLPIFGLTLHNDGYAKDWISYLMAKQTKSSDFMDPKSPLPDPDIMAARLNTTYKTLVAIILGLHYSTNQILEPCDIPLQGTVTYATQRIMVSTPLYIVSAVILSLNLITAVVFFAYARRNRLPWVPSSLAATIAYLVADDQALADVQRTATMSTRQRDRFLEARGAKYRLGRFVDAEGKTRIGIGRAEDALGP